MIRRFGIPAAAVAAAFTVIMLMFGSPIVNFITGNTSSSGSVAIVGALKAAVPTEDEIIAAAQTDQVKSQQPVIVSVAVARITPSHSANPYKDVTGTHYSKVTGITMHFGTTHMTFMVNGKPIHLKANQAIITWKFNGVLLSVVMTFHVAPYGFAGTVTLTGAPHFDFKVGDTVSIVVQPLSFTLVMDRMADPATFSR